MDPLDNTVNCGPGIAPPNRTSKHVACESSIMGCRREPCSVTTMSLDAPRFGRARKDIIFGVSLSYHPTAERQLQSHGGCNVRAAGKRVFLQPLTMQFSRGKAWSGLARYVPPDAMTLSGVTRRGIAEAWGGILAAGSLRIGTFEGSRSRLGQTRAIIGI